MNIIKMFAFTFLSLSPIAYAVEVEQMPVLRQKRGGSCGYHALRNGILIADSINNLSSKEALTSVDLALVSEKTESLAYRSIIRSRARKLAAYFIKDYLLQSMQGTLVDKSTANSYALNLKSSSMQLNSIEDAELLVERPFFCNKLINVAHNLVEAQSSTIGAEQRYEITLESLVRAFDEEIKKADLTYNVSNNLDKKINSLFVGFETLRFSVLNDTIIKDENNNNMYQANYSNGNLRESSSTISGPGEWLSSQEINDLLQLERSNPNSFLNKKTQVFVLDNALEEQLEEEQDLKELISNMQKKDFEGIVILIVYYPSHWITCVINKQKDHEPIYLFADSLNINRLKDKKTLTIIESISGSYEKELEVKANQAKEIEAIEVIQANIHYALEINAKNILEKSEIIKMKQAENNYKLSLPLLILFLEDGNLLRVQALVDQLKKNESQKKGILLQGPAGAGKYALAQKIGYLTQREVISSLSEEVIRASGIQENEDESAKKEKILEVMLKKASNNKKGNSILLIDGIESFSQEALRKLYRSASGYRKTPFFIIAITRDNNLANNSFISSFLEPIIIGLPSFNLRQNVFCYYLLAKGVVVNKERIDNGVSTSAIASLATATRGYSGKEIKEITNNAVERFQHTNAPSLFQVPYTHRLANQYDFKDKKALSFFTAITPLPFLFATNPSKIESHLWAYQYTHDQRRKSKSIRENNNIAVENNSAAKGILYEKFKFLGYAGITWAAEDTKVKEILAKKAKEIVEHATETSMELVKNKSVEVINKVCGLPSSTTLFTE